MHTDYVRMSLIGAWVLAIGTLGLVLGATSLTVWIALAFVSLVPPVVVGRLWTAPAASMSETIRESLR